MANTVVLKWNPAFSSYTTLHFLSDLYEPNKVECGFDWSVWEYEKIKEGDRFYMLKLGYGQTGIVMRGTITSDPEEGEDWSGRGRKTFYVYFEPDFMLDPDAFPLLTSQELQKEISDFDWFKGHSGVVLSPEQAEKLEELWKNYMIKNREIFNEAGSKQTGTQRIYDPENMPIF